MNEAAESDPNRMEKQRQRGKELSGATTEGGSRMYWVWQVLGWGGYGLSYYATVLVPLHQAGWTQSTSDALYCAAGMTTTHLLRGWMRSRGWLQLETRRLLWRLIAACLVLGGLQAVVLESSLVLFRVIDRSEFVRLPESLLIVSFFSAIVIGLWLAVYIVVHSVRSRRRAELDRLRAEVTLQEAQLKALRQQINPHFLFNSLNSIRGMIDEDAGGAREMVTRLADLMRFALQAGEQGMVTVEEELKVVEDYLALEAVRLEERLRVEWRIDPSTRLAQFPAMMLQGLVENAIKHGISRLTAGGWIRIEVRMEVIGQDERLAVFVENSGRLAAMGEGGIGLRNTRERLQLLYPERAGVEMRETEKPSVAVKLWLPLEPTAASRTGSSAKGE